MKAILLLTLAISFAGTVFAHKDRRLSLSTDGSIPELPAQYKDARLRIKLPDARGGTLAIVGFASSGRETEIKSCLWRHIRSKSLSQVALSGSWYHERSTLPHYVAVLFLDPDAQGELPELPGIRFLFSLADARLLEVTQVVALPRENAVQERRVDLTNGCPSGK